MGIHFVKENASTKCQKKLQATSSGEIVAMLNGERLWKNTLAILPESDCVRIFNNGNLNRSHNRIAISANYTTSILIIMTNNLYTVNISRQKNCI